ncbi:MAG: hypothetical protein KAG66_08155 [Methylococcales bacterium]|nr:hypothetical protein [Methylococcales bacterium]
MLKSFNLLNSIILLLLISGCSLLPSTTQPAPAPPSDSPPTDPSIVGDMLPKLGGAYHTVEGQTVTGFLGTTSEGLALLGARPDLAAAIGFTDDMIGCYQDKEAVLGRVYASKDYLLSAGAVAIGDRDEILDPQNLFECLVRSKLPFSAAPQIEACSNNYTLSKDGNEFYIIYAGTTAEICQDFCANLEGCTE